MKIEQVGFDGKRLVAKCWPQADVGDRIKSFVIHARARQINAVAGDKIVIATQVDGWHSVCVAITASASGSARNAEAAPQPRPRSADLARQQEPAYLVASDWNPTHHHHR